MVAVQLVYRSEPYSEIFHISSLWRIRQMNVCKYMFMSASTQHMYSQHSLGSERIHIIKSP